ncbi:peptidase inhibitor family I36 protein [Nonomuraea sp. NPDC050556]|uniref:peptidase inhibitor family I36 protein n=1 Tax=Nonomuraea sp. NPDC050556 TaxID=3364369 RepID=UPI00378F289E
MGKKLHLLALPIAAAAVLSSVPAQAAATGYDRCHAGYYCMFSGLDGTGDIIEIQSDTPDLAALNMASRGKSDWNRTSSLIHLYSEANYQGCSAVTGTGAGAKGNFYITFRDYFNSVKIGGPNGPSCETFAGTRTNSHG